MTRRRKTGQVGAPELVIDDQIFEELCKIQCTVDEMAAVFKVSNSTIKRRLRDPKYRELKDQGNLLGKVSIRRQGFLHMRRPNGAGVQAWMHLTKHILGWTEKTALEISAHIESTVEVKDSHDRVSARLNDLANRIASRFARLVVDNPATTVLENGVASGTRGAVAGDGTIKVVSVPVGS